MDKALDMELKDLIYYKAQIDVYNELLSSNNLVKRKVKKKNLTDD